MPISGKLVWKNPDSTVDLNSAWGVVSKGIYEGGTITTSGSSLQFTVNPFTAKSFDGMTVISTSLETLTITSGPTPTVQYLVLFAKYGIPDAITQLQVLSAASYASSPNKDYFVTLCRFQVPALATSSSQAVITYDESDFTERMGKSAWRPSVANFASLPLTKNRDGDVRTVADTSEIYIWSALTATWVAYGSATSISEITIRSGALGDQVERSAHSTSGLIGGVLNSASLDHVQDLAFAGVDVDMQTAVAANTLVLGAVHAQIHGHFIKRRAETITLPAAGNRYDLVFLEAWQEILPSAYGYTYTNAAGSQVSAQAIIAALNVNAETSVGNNWTIDAIELVDATTIVVTKSAYRVVSNVPVGSIYTPVTGMATATNGFGNVYAQMTGSDTAAFIANAPSVWSQRTWAIPILVLARSATEGVFNAYNANNDRTAFSVAPVATNGYALASLLSQQNKAARLEPTPKSGWLELATIPQPVSSTLTVSAPGTMRVQGSYLSTVNAYTNTVIPTAPLAGGNRTFVYMHLENARGPSVSGLQPLGGYESAIGPGGGVQSFAWYGRMISSTVTGVDEADSFAELGYSQVPGDPALWRRLSPNFPTKDGYVYALALGIGHRRNSTAWSLVNPNGSVNRPDGLNNSAIIDFRKEWVNLQHRVMKSSEIGEVVEKSFSALKAGSLKTRLRQHPYFSDVYGTEVMMHTLTSSAPVAGKHVITPVPAANTAVSVWGDAEEAVCLSFRMTAPGSAQASADGVFSWTPANANGSSGTMVITAPAGMVLAQSNFQVLGPFNRATFNAGDTNPVCPQTFQFAVNTATGVISQGVPTAASWTGNTSATLTSTAWFVDAANVECTFSVWFRKTAGTSGSLFGSPTRIHSVTHGAESLNVGPIIAKVRKIFTGTSVTITQADVFAARPDISSLSNQIAVYGVSNYRSTSSLTLSTVALSNGAGAPGFTQALVTFTGSAPVNTDIEFDVMCAGNVKSRWVEVVPESRRVRGVYSYGTAFAGTYSGNVGGGSGFVHSWQPAYAASSRPAVTRGASFADTSMDIVTGGVMMGNQVGSNTSATSSLFPQRTQVDFIYTHVSASAYVQFYQNNYLTSISAPTTTLFAGLLPRTISATNIMTSLDPEIYQAQSPHTRLLTLGALTSSVTFPTIGGMGIVEDAPTQPVELIYDIPVYQGVVQSTEMRTRLRGKLSYIGGTDITSEGPTFTPTPVAMVTQGSYSTRAGLTPTVANHGAMYVPVSLLEMDSGPFATTGLVAKFWRDRKEPKVSLLRQIPFPLEASPSQFNRTPVTKSPVVSTKRKSVAGALGTVVSPSTQAVQHDPDGLLTVGLGFRVFWNFDLPQGSVIHNVEIVARSLAGNITASFKLCANKMTVEGNVNSGHTVASLDAALTANSSVLKLYPWIATGVSLTESVNNRYLLNYLCLNRTSFYVECSDYTNNLYIQSVDVIYTSIDGGEIRTLTYNEPTANVYYSSTGLVTMATSLKARNMEASRVEFGKSLNRNLGAFEGSIIDAPASWSTPLDNQLVSAVFSDGSIDQSSDWVRGQTSSDSGLFAYVPFSGWKLKDNRRSVTTPTLTYELPVSTPKTTVAVAESNPAVVNIIQPGPNFVASVTPYGMVTSSQNLTLGVSTGVEVITVVNDYRAVDLSVGGSTIDAFYPLGRPVIED